MSYLDGVPCLALVDTGSQVTTVSEGFYEEYLSNCPIQQIDDILKVEGANGQEVPFLGYLQTNISFPEHTSGLHEQVDALVLVVPNTSFNKDVPVVIGTNVIRRCKDICLNLHGVNYLRTAEPDMAWRLAYRHLSWENRKSKSLASMMVKLNPEGPQEVGAMQTTTVWATINTKKLGRSAWALIEDEDSKLPQPLQVIPSLARLEMDGNLKRVPVRITNPSGKSVTLAPSIVCSIQQVTRVYGSTGEQESDCHDEFLRMLKQHSLDDEQLKKAEELMDKWRTKVFSGADEGIGCTSSVKHKINLDDNVPFKQRHRRIPPAQYDEVREHLQGLIDSGVIRESHSPWASPVVLVRKKDGSLRFCIDYRKLNTRTIKDAYALPRIEEALEAMGGCSWFSTLDLKSGYYQVEIEEKDKKKTAFTVGPLGFYEFNRMPFGLTNAPATFQRLMEHCLADMNFEKCIVYIDDVIVYSKTFDEHLERLEAVFTKLEEFGLKLKTSKCSLFRDKVKYLGHVISANGIETDPEKIEAVKTWPVPKGTDELRTFLGFTGYYRKFVPDYAKKVKPLTNLLKAMTPGKGRKSECEWAWSEKCQEAFENVRSMLSSPLVLSYPDFTKQFILNTDASLDGLGATLSQEIDGKEKVIGYASRALRKSERNYPVHKLEFLSLKWAVTEKFHDYLYGNNFIVRTDNNPLTYVNSTAKLDAAGHRWLAALANYNFEIHYRPGKKNADADALSRRPYESASVVGQESIVAICQMSAHRPPYFDVSEADEVECVEPLPTMDQETLSKLQEEDLVIGRVKEFLIKGVRPTRKALKNEEKRTQKILRLWDQLFVEEGVIYRRGGTGPQGEKVVRLLLPESLRKDALAGVHDHVGHFATERTLDLAKARFYWVGMANDVEQWVKTCERCILRRRPQPEQSAGLVNIVTTEPMELVCIDYLKLDRCKGGFEHVLVITDHFSRFAQAIPTTNQTARTTAKALFDKFVVHYGFPARIHSDQGRNFESDLIKELCKLAQVSKSRTTPYHPMGNGMCERFNRTLMHMLGTLADEEKVNWKDFVAPLVHAYNATKHSSTGVSPFYVMFGRHPRLAIDVRLGHDLNGFQSKSSYVRDLTKRLELAYKLAADNAKESSRHQKTVYDKRRPTARLLLIGDEVLVKNVTPKSKLENFWEGDIHVVVGKPNDEIPVYCVVKKDGTGRKRNLHRNLLMPLPPGGLRVQNLETEKTPAQPKSRGSQKQTRLQVQNSGTEEIPAEPTPTRPQRQRKKPRWQDCKEWEF